jgi:hypothetical protein
MEMNFICCLGNITIDLLKLGYELSFNLSQVQIIVGPTNTRFWYFIEVKCSISKHGNCLESLSVEIHGFSMCVTNCCASNNNPPPHLLFLNFIPLKAEIVWPPS